LLDIQNDYFGYPEYSCRGNLFWISKVFFSDFLKIFWEIQKKTIILDIRKKCFQISEIVISDMSKCLLGYLEKRMQYYGYLK